MFKAVFGGVALSLALWGTAFAQTCPNYTYPLTNGATADANQVMGNFNGILNCANTALAPLANPHFTGSVGIGTATPATPLDVYGAVVVGLNAQYGLYTRIADGTVHPFFAQSGGYTVFYNAGGIGYAFRNQADTSTLFYLDNVGNASMYGSVVAPSQPAFLASINSATDATVAANTYIPFNSTNYNVGSGFNPTTHVFTAPVTGYYSINYGIYFTNSGSSTWDMMVAPSLNGALVYGAAAALCALETTPNGVGGGHILLSASCELHLNAGDTLGLVPPLPSGLRHFQGHAWFGMRLLG